MCMDMSVKVKMLLAAKGMTVTDLAARLDPPTSSQNLYGKFKRNNLTEKDLIGIAKACGVQFEGNFIFEDGTKI